MRCISPELVSVDPALAHLARELLPDPDDCLERPRRSRAVGVHPELTETRCSASAAELAAARSLTVGRVVAGPEVTLSAGAGRAGRPTTLTWGRRVRRDLALAGRCIAVLAVIGIPLLAFLPADESQRPRFAIPLPPDGALAATQPTGQSCQTSGRRTNSGDTLRRATCVAPPAAAPIATRKTIRAK